MRARRASFAAERHYKPEEAAVQAGVCTMTIRRAIADGAQTRGVAGIHPVRRLGRRYLIPATALQRWLEALPVHGA
jgi:hypothetical protein